VEGPSDIGPAYEFGFCIRTGLAMIFKICQDSLQAWTFAIPFKRAKITVNVDPYRLLEI
jgi:hypothetical protein